VDTSGFVAHTRYYQSEKREDGAKGRDYLPIRGGTLPANAKKKGRGEKMEFSSGTKEKRGSLWKEKMGEESFSSTSS